MSWLVLALLSALFAALTAILAKIGVAGIPSSLATAVRTSVVLPFTWIIAFAAGDVRSLPAMPRKTLIFLVLSGLATGASWLAYFRALQLGPASRVAPIDKLSLPLTLLLAIVVLGEPFTFRLGIGVGLMVVGALLTIS